MKRNRRKSRAEVETGVERVVRTRAVAGMRKILDRNDGRVGFRVRVQPSAPVNELLGWNAAGELRMKVTASPVEGAANRKLISYLAKRFSLRKSDIRIESGETSRVKTISVPASVRNLLLDIPEG